MVMIFHNQLTAAQFAFRARPQLNTPSPRTVQSGLMKSLR
jgi:hypothetical protein